MTATDSDIASYIAGLGLNVNAFDPIHLKDYGVLVEERGSPVPEILLNYTTSIVDVTVKETGQGERGTERSCITAWTLYNRMKLLFNITISGTEYPRIMAVNSPYRVGEGDNWSAYRFTLSVDRATEGITWQ